MHRLLPLLLLLLASPALAQQPQAAGEDIPGFTAIQRGHGLSLHRNNYVLPLTWTEDWNGSTSEFVYQFSVKQRLPINNLYGAYTQRSFWQAINHDASSPFRETNYNPEIFYRWMPGDEMFRRWHLDRWGFDAGFEHESNGRIWPESRSLNRVYFAPFRPSSKGRSLWYVKMWYRLPESEKSNPLDQGGDDNPDYYKFFGYTQATYTHEFESRWMVQAMARGNLATGRGAGELVFSVPATDRSFFWVITLFSGYGESLIDYNHEVSRIGLGVMFNR